MPSVNSIEALTAINTAIHQGKASPMAIWIMTPGGLIVGLLDHQGAVYRYSNDGTEYGDFGTNGDEVPTDLVLSAAVIVTQGLSCDTSWAVIPIASVQAWGTDLVGPFGAFGLKRVSDTEKAAPSSGG